MTTETTPPQDDDLVVSSEITAPKQTTHSTTDKGAKARFRFEGSKVIVFGTVPATNASDKPPTIRYSIDKQNSMELTVPVANTAITNQPLFSASNLRRSPHELVIELVKGEAPYILEQFFVQPHPRFPNGDGNARGGITRDGDNGNDGGKGNGPGPSFPPRPMGSGNIPGSRSPSSTAAPVESPSDSSEAEASTRAVQILSGTLGALIALILLGVLIYFLRRRQITKRKSDRFFSKFFKYASPRPETIYTSFTTPESIQRNEPSFLMRGSSAFTQGSSAFTRGSPAFTRGSEGPPSDLRVSMVSPVMVQSMPRLSMATIPPARLNATTRS
ncbi:hypothetical protein FA15DRAFT_517922 [Coprinopsis marcescibilis]|uniref:Uncharacterized protein n=1 Tax=Coprinopsis marcescibilis TaxID=230819 RepID=A0A5C3KPH4_COPMA|nr:hypothetical protein FA15DRAFT_517922 [Coprinopsis marcescibilis]